MNKTSPTIKMFVRHARSAKHVTIHDWELIDSVTGEHFTGKNLPMLTGLVYHLDKRIRITKTTPIDAYNDLAMVYYTAGVHRPIKWKLGRPNQNYIESYPNVITDLNMYYSTQLQEVDTSVK